MRTTLASLALASLLAACGGTHTNEQPLLNCGPAPDAKTVTIDDAANGTTITLSTGDALAIQLGDAGDGGYTWSVVDDGGLGTANETHLDGSGATGDFGTDVFTFGTIAATTGSHVVKLTDARSFDTSDAMSYTVTVVVQ